MKKSFITIFAAAALLTLHAADAVVWNAGNNFKNWAQPVRLSLTRGKDAMQIKITGNDPSFVISGINIDPANYSQIEFIYRARNLKRRSGQIFFAPRGKGFNQTMSFVFKNLRNDWQWHRAVIPLTRINSGKDKWLKAGNISRLRVDITDGNAGEFEIKELRITAPQGSFIVPGTEDVASISVLHLKIMHVGMNHKRPLWIGKPSHHDHRHRGLFRFPLETLTPAGKVKKAVFQFQLDRHYGRTVEREYLVEVMSYDIQKFKALDVKGDAVTIGKIKIGDYSVNEPVCVDVTKEVNSALEKVQTGITFLVRPEPERNLDPTPSGAIVERSSIRLVTE